MSTESGQFDPPLKLVLCSWATGVGAGAGRMETYYYRFLSRDLFEPVFVSLDDPSPRKHQYDSSIPWLYTGSKDRFRTLLEFFADADIVQFQGGFDPLVCEAARSSQVPVLVEVIHNIEPGRAFPYIDISICVSESASAVQNVPDKAVTILNGIDLDEFPYSSIPINDQRIVLLQVSNRHKTFFNIDELADEILSLDPRIEIWLAGPGQTAESTNRVKFLGLRNDISELYQQADLMVLFSRNEPFGLVAVEAMACGCLPLVTNRGGFREIITNDQDGWLVPPDNRKASVETIARALAVRKTPKWEEMRAAARKTVEQRFCARRCVKDYEQIYRKLINQKGRRSGRGSTTAVASPEADIGDAVFHSHRRQWDRVEEAMVRVADHSDSVINPCCADAALMLAQTAIEREKLDIAEKICRKLYYSRFVSSELLNIWLQVLPPDCEISFLVEEILSFASKDAGIVLQLVERYVSQRRLELANQILQQAIDRCDELTATKKVYLRWQRELARCKDFSE